MIMVRLRVIAFATACLAVADGTATAADRPVIVGANVGLQAGLTLLRGIVEGRVRNRQDVRRRLLWGGASGAAFYGAKELIGSANIGAGWILSNVAASVSENAAVGRHPIAQLGYSLGPVRFRVPLPRFQEDADAHAYFDVSAFQTVALLMAMVEHDRMVIKGGGLIGFERDLPYPADLRRANSTVHTGGSSIGMFPGVWTGMQQFGLLDPVWRHEAVHAVQSLQFDAAEPSFGFLTSESDRARDGQKRRLRFEHLKLGIMNTVESAIEGSIEYENRWREIEAYRLVNETDL